MDKESYSNTSEDSFNYETNEKKEFEEFTSIYHNPSNYYNRYQRQKLEYHNLYNYSKLRYYFNVFGRLFYRKGVNVFLINIQNSFISSLKYFTLCSIIDYLTKQNFLPTIIKESIQKLKNWII